jgi:putative oxidoreductase
VTTPATPVPARPAPPPVGRWILLTGASGGIGRATALRLADVGRVVFAAARRADQLQALAATPPGVRPVVLDVTHAASIDRARDQIMAETGGYGLEVLVNAAGILVLGPVEAVFQTTGRRLDGLLRRAVPLLLRGSLGVTFVWFGALKLAGASTLPASLIAAITPSVDPDVSEPLVGAFEVALGAGLLLGRWMPVFVAAAALQLAGTFLVLVLRPDVAFVDGNPLRLGVEGGYVVKNLVLLAATAALALHSLTPRPVQGNGSPSRGRPGPGQRDTYRARGMSAGRQPVGEGPRLTMTINGNREWTL